MSSDGPVVIKVLLVDDHTLVRQSIREVLGEQKDLIVVGEAGDGREAWQRVKQLNPHVVIMDISMKGLNGFEAMRQIHKGFPHIGLVVLSMHTDHEYVTQAFQCGAKGFVSKTCAIDDLLRAIHLVMRGDVFVSPTIQTSIIREGKGDIAKKISSAQQFDSGSLSLLTTREREVLQLIAEGHSAKEIGRMLRLSVKTIENHRSNIMAKLNIHDRVGLVKYALKKGLIQIES